MVHTEGAVKMSITANTNDYLKSVISKSSILITEYVINYNFFNTSRESTQNIFKIYDNFDIHISLPNCKKITLFSKDIITYDSACNKMYLDYIKGLIPIEILKEFLEEKRNNEVDRYCKIIEKSDVSEMSQFIKDNVMDKRLFHTINHPTNILFIEMQRILLKKFFDRDIPIEVIELNNLHEFLPSHGYNTQLTYYDDMCLHYVINENYLSKEDSDTYFLNMT